MNYTVLGFFVATIAVTLLITYWASRRNSSAESHYVADRNLTGWQNGLAIAGDYISGATLLGTIGGIALLGFDGFFFGLGSPVAIALVLLILAEPLRRLGKYTVSDIITTRFNRRDIRSLAALNIIAITIVYMVAQFVGAGAIVSLLLGIDFTFAAIIVGVLMLVYTTWGGMLAATWIQILQMFLLAVGFVVLLILTLAQFDFNPLAATRDAIEVYGSGVLTSQSTGGSGGLSTVSLQLGIVLGFLAMPHVMIRFFTVPDSRTARSSAVTATWAFALFYASLPIAAYGAVSLIGREAIAEADPGGNLTVILLAEYVGGDVFLAFMAAVALVTIMASLSGMCIAAAGAFGHDLYTNVFKNGRASESEQHRAARIASFGFALVALAISLAASSFNVAFLSTLAFAIAASANLPTILFSIFWRGFNVTGAIVGMSVGLVVSVVLVLTSPTVLQEGALFPLTNPAIVSVPVGFLACYVGSLFGKQSPADRERAREVLLEANLDIPEEHAPRSEQVSTRS